MKRTTLTSSAISLLLLGVALVVLFGLTSLDIEHQSGNEVTSVGDKADDVASAVEEAPEEKEKDAPTEIETAAAPEPLPLPEQSAEPEPTTQVAGTTSFQTAGSIVFTGDVEIDFPDSNPNVLIVDDVLGNNDVGLPRSDDGTDTLLVPGPSGFEIDDIRFLYDRATDELLVGINFFVIGGDAEGDGDPGNGPIVNILTGEATGLGTDVPAWGAGESFSVSLELSGAGTADVIAGVQSEQDIGGFNVFEGSLLSNLAPALPLAYGPVLPNALGSAPSDTSVNSPDIEFSISSFSAIGDPTRETIGVFAFAGSSVDSSAEEFVNVQGQFTQIPNPLFGTPEITIEKSTNDIDADTAAEGPQLLVGSTATFDYVVTNTGDVDLVDVTVTDDILGDICPIAALPVDGSETCQAIATVTAGDYVNVGTARGFEDDGAGNPTGQPVTDTDPSHHSGLASGIDVEKSLNGEDLDNLDELIAGPPSFPIGSTITFDFEVTNTGDYEITGIELEDNVLGTITCPLTALPAGESMSCSGDHVVTEGLTRNDATVTGQPVDGDGNPIGGPVTDTDPAHHEGVLTSISIEKATNGEDADVPNGPEIEAGDDVTFTYVVTNDGPADVVDLTVTDDIEGDVCVIDALAAGESESCTLMGTAGIGQYANIGTVTGQPVDEDGTPFGDPLTATDPSHHIGVCSNAVEGPVLYRGSQTIWNTTLIAGDDSTIVLTTSENGGSPGQPNEQVYVEVAGVLYGPSPAGLGTITLDIVEGGQVRVLHISEVDTDITGANSVVPSLCGDDLIEMVPVCSDLVQGPVLHAFSDTVWETGFIAEDGSTIRVVTEENGGSPGQPNEQVYLQVGDDIYGPTFAGLGDTQFEITTGGPVTILHYSEVTGDRSSANSVVPSLCGDGLAAVPGPICPITATGPRMIQGRTTVWDSGLTAAAGSEITILTFDSISSLTQPNEQVYVRVGDEVYGPTPAGRGEITIPIDNTGEVTILHYSEINGRQHSVNSVEYEFCGTGLTQTIVDYSMN